MPVIFLQKQTDVYCTAKSHRHASPIALPTPGLPLSSSERDVDSLIANPPNRRDNVTLFEPCVQLQRATSYCSITSVVQLEICFTYLTYDDMQLHWTMQHWLHYSDHALLIKLHCTLYYIYGGCSSFVKTFVHWHPPFRSTGSGWKEQRMSDEETNGDDDFVFLYFQVMSFFLVWTY